MFHYEQPTARKDPAPTRTTIKRRKYSNCRKKCSSQAEKLMRNCKQALTAWQTGKPEHKEVLFFPPSTGQSRYTLPGFATPTFSCSGNKQAWT